MVFGIHKKIVIPAKAGIQILIFILGIGVAFAKPQPGDFYASGPTDQNVISLTFDDGPGSYTEKFLDLLDQYKVKATFFVQGQNVRRRPSIVKMIKERGHEVASHTWNHVNYKKRLGEIQVTYSDSKNPSEKAYREIRQELSSDIRKTNREIKKVIGEVPLFLRMPHGIDRPWIKEVAKKEGMVLVNWSYGADWRRDPLEKLKKDHMKAIRPGAIFLFHDGGGKREKSLELVQTILQKAQEKQFSIVPIGQLLK